MKNNNHPDFNHIELWHRITSFIVFSVMMLNLMIPFSISAATIVDKSFFSTELASGQYYEPAYTGDFLYKKSSLINTTAKTIPYSIADFFKELANVKSPALPAKVLVPVQVSDITIFVPINKLGKLAGDAEVQARLIRSQIYNVFSRNTIQAGLTEAQQIAALYANSALLAAQGGVTFGKEISESQANNFGKDFIWPVEMTLNGESVLVPQLYLSDATVKDFTLKGHLVEFHGTTAEFHHINIGAGSLVNVRNNYLKASGNFNLGENARIVGENDVNLIVHGTLQNLSGTITASKNINILAGQLSSKRVVHRFDTGQYQGTRLGEVAGYLANGHIQIRTYGDMQFESSVLNAGGSIQLKADGNIRIAAQQESIVGGRAVGGYRTTDSAFAYLGSSLTAKDSVFLMASGAIEINASTLHADSGVIQLLAQQGVYIGNEMNQFQQSRQGKLGKVTEQEQQLQTMAVRSALNAGKGVLIATELGDITLKATSIKAGQGTEVSARNGKLNLLLAKEQDEYFYNKVKKGTWKIKTETKQDQTDTAVYNAIVGGVKVHASRGVTLELAQKEGQSISQVMSDMAATTDLAWMNTLYNDPQFAGNIDLAYQTLQDLHLHKKTSNLSPAAMAVIAIAVAVAMGPHGANLLGKQGAIAKFAIGSKATAAGTALAGSMQAGALTLATQAANGLASGKGLGGTLESMVQEDSLRSLAISMVTAGALSQVTDFGSDLFGNAASDAAFLSTDTLISLGNQAAQTIVNATVSAGISSMINGTGFQEFQDSLVKSIKTNAINQLGQHMAEEIGAAVDDKKINTALQLISHAALGCTIGIASASVNKTNSSGIACSSGAAGAVIGEVISDKFKEKENYQAERLKLETELKRLGVDPKNYENMSAEAARELQESVEVQKMMQDLNLIKAKGVDLAKLGAALALFAVKGDVNIAADTAENAAANNAFWFAVQAGYMIYKAIELHNTITEVSEKLKEFAKADEKRRQEIIIDIAITFSIDLLVGKTASELLGTLIKQAKKSGIIPDQVLAEMIAFEKLHLENKSSQYKTGSGSPDAIKVHSDPEIANVKKAVDRMLGDKTKTAKPTKGGHINGKQVQQFSVEIQLSAADQKILNDKLLNWDQLSKQEKGAFTEQFTQRILSQDPRLKEIDGKYGSNNGADHLYLTQNSDGTLTTVLATLDSKQLTSSGGLQLGKGAGGNTQFSLPWFKAIAVHLGNAGKHDAKNAIEQHISATSMRLAVSYIDPATKKLFILPVDFPLNKAGN